MAKISEDEFNTKFKKLNPVNQKYIIAIQQAFLFAQSNNENESDKSSEKDK